MEKPCLLGLTACGSEGSSDFTATPAAATQNTPAEAENTAEAAEPTSGAVFPVTITHKYGTTIVPEAPQRGVAIGYNEQDALLALGIKPVAVRYW